MIVYKMTVYPDLVRILPIFASWANQLLPLLSLSKVSYLDDKLYGCHIYSQYYDFLKCILKLPNENTTWDSY